MKIVVWNYVENGVQEFKTILKSTVKIVRVISPGDADQDQLLLSLDYDYLLVLENGLREWFVPILNALRIPDEKVIYAYDMISWSTHADVGCVLLREDCFLYRQCAFIRGIYGKGRCALVNVDDLSYVGSSWDTTILLWMYCHQQNFAKEGMHAFYRLAKRYYPGEAKDGWFLDIGANIGTTAIYFKKHICSSISVLAFEADPETYSFLKINAKLNGLDDDDIILENLGLDESSRKIVLHRDLRNPGGNSAIKDYGGKSVTVPTIALDSYLMEHGISGSDIRYMWIDVEGFEPQVLKGAERVLSEFDIPVFMEFNPYLWVAAGRFDEMMSILTRIYGAEGGYIVADEATIQEDASIHGIDELWRYKGAKRSIPGMSDIFLVKSRRCNTGSLSA